MSSFAGELVINVDLVHELSEGKMNLVESVSQVFQRGYGNLGEVNVGRVSTGHSADIRQCQAHCGYKNRYVRLTVSLDLGYSN